MTKLDTILFDFDGVLVDSLDIKADAFHDMYLSYGKEAADFVRSHHTEHGGVSRYEKFKIYHKKFEGEELSEQKLSELVETYSKIVKQRVIECENVQGAEEFLESVYQKADCYVITGTPMHEIKEVIAGKGWTKYFKDIFGSPEKKTHWVDFLQNQNKANPSTTIFLGDATADYQASVHGKMLFALRTHSDNYELFKNIDCIRFNNFDDLLLEFEKNDISFK